MLDTMSSNKPSRRRSSGANSYSAAATAAAKAQNSAQLTYGFIREVSPNRSTAKGTNHVKNASSTSSRRHSHQSPSVMEREQVANERRANLNRWSQSTVSSMSTAAGHNRDNSFTKRLSLGSPFQPASGFSRRSPSPRKMQSKPMDELDEHRSDAADRIEATEPESHTATTPPQQAAPTLSRGLGDSIPSLQPLTFGEHDYSSGQSRVPPSSNFDSSPPRIPAIQPTSANLQTNSYTEDSTAAAESEDIASRNAQVASSPTKVRKNRTEDKRRGGSGTQSPRRARSKREKEKKAMLSRALLQAQEAVKLDHVQSYESAIVAYTEACSLLALVLEMSSSDDDKRKLGSIRSTYQIRIDELRELETYPSADEISSHETEAPAIPVASQRPQVDGADDHVSKSVNRKVINEDQVPDPGVNPAYESEAEAPTYFEAEESQATAALSEPPLGSRDAQEFAPRMNKEHMPPPLTPWRQPSAGSSTAPIATELSTAIQDFVPSNDEIQTQPDVAKNISPAKSWLGAAKGSSRSANSSVHSVSSQNEIHRKHLRTQSGGTEAEFDAALDAAVEAAYDGYDPYDYGHDNDHLSYSSSRLPDPLFSGAAPALGVDKKSMIESAAHLSEQQQTRQIDEPSQDHVDDEDSADEEERMLDQLTREYMVESFTDSTKPSLPRQSDSSSFSGRTWKSSTASSGTTAATSLSTVGEDKSIPHNLSMPYINPPTSRPPSSGVPSLPPPMGKLPPPPIIAHPATQVSNLALPQSPSVRDRRLSGKDAKKLHIETAPSLGSGSRPQSRERSISPTKSRSVSSNVPQKTLPTIPDIPRASAPGDMKPPPPPIPGSHGTYRQTSSPLPRQESSESVPIFASEVTQPPTSSGSQESFQRSSPKSASPNRGWAKLSGERTFIRKNASSLSLKGRELPTPTSDGPGPAPPSTPMDFGFAPMPAYPQNKYLAPQALTNTPATTPMSATFGRLNRTPLTTPVTASFSRLTDDQLFESDFHAPKTPGSPNPTVENGPSPLEPCPSSFLLRPFWLMRCLYQTIANPRGGYMSTRVFVPKGVWMVQNVKLKGVEDKIANCDLLTAALLKLGAVDNLDADAMLEEMQALENVFEQAQANLAKKLGNEVGLQGLPALFKDMPSTSPDGSQSTDTGSVSGSSSKSGSGKFSSWRRLRSKSSGVGLTQSYSSARDQQAKDSMPMSTVPMTVSPMPIPRTPKRDLASVVCNGPNANYMNALVRLFDAVQVLDQIARQVEDPGLRHSSQTWVGLELCSRHAAEFFAFYICRFVVTDVTMLLEKFIKRASEWVMA